MAEEYNEMALRIIASACDLTECEFETPAKEIAKAISEAEARGRAAERADVVAWLEAESRARFDECDEHGPDMQGELSALAETLSGLAGAVGKGTHVGTAGKDGG